MAKNILVLSLLATTFALVVASDPSSLQEFCVTDPTSSARVNVFSRLDSRLALANRFSFNGLHATGNTSNPLGSGVTSVTVAQIPGLNTLGISLACLDCAPWGLIPPHIHPRATKILTVLEGSLMVGFVTSNPDNNSSQRFFCDVFAFPVGLVHFQGNVGYGKAVSLSALSSQNPGIIIIANAVCGSNPNTAEDILSKTFQVDKSVVAQLQQQF